MSQATKSVPNQSRTSYRAAVNAALQALATKDSGATAPSETYPFMFWADTSANKLKQRDSLNASWVVIGDLDMEALGLLPKAGGALAGILQMFAGADIASAATVDLGAATGNDITITHSSGTTATTGFGGATTIQKGARIRCRASISGGTYSLTHNATSMKLPGGTNITVQDGDSWDAVKIHNSNAYWRVESYTRADGTPLVPVNFASNAEYEAGTDTLKALNSAVARARNVIRGSVQAMSGQSAVNVTGLPSWVTNILIQVAGLSMSSTQAYGVQIGDSGGLESSGYTGAGSRWASSSTNEAPMTSSYLLNSAVAAAYRGHIHLSKVEGTNTWIMSATLGDASSMLMSGGEKTLSGTLDRFSILVASGTFDNGNISYLAW
jgi:hypothetical protein